MILDNYATHKHPDVVAWLDKHPRFHLHFTPTSSSWLNLVERWFRELTDKAIRRGVFGSVPTLITAIEEYLEAHNERPQGVRVDRHRRADPRQSRPLAGRPSRAIGGRDKMDATAIDVPDGSSGARAIPNNATASTNTTGPAMLAMRLKST